MPQKPVTEAENEANRAELEALRALLKHPAWKYLVGMFSEAKNTHAEGLAAVGVEPAKRAEHVQAYHDSKAYPHWPLRRITYLEDEIARHTKGQ